MNRTILSSLFVSALLAGCHATQMPTLCVFKSSALAQGEAAGDHECAGIDPTSADALVKGPNALTDGESYYIKFELPDGVAPIGSLHVHLETPCAKDDLDADPVDGVVLLPAKAPAGAQCGLVITATMANSELSVDIPPSLVAAADGAVSCADLATVCPAATE